MILFRLVAMGIIASCFALEGLALPKVEFADKGTFGVLIVKWDGQTDQVKWRYGKLEQPEIRIGTPDPGNL